MQIAEKKVENLPVYVFDTREEMGKVAAADAAKRINAVIEKNGVANVIFAAAPSQNDLFENLLKEDIDWSKVRGFHQDEYVGIDASEPAGFGNFLRRAIFDHVQFKEIHYLLCDESEAEKKCEEYADLLKKYPADLIFLGIGENGHLAFNDPAVADFEDPKMVKIVELDDVCRQQQVNDGCFATLDDVPKFAMTLTMSYIMSVSEAICVVPTDRKANAVYGALEGPVTTECPASILRKHANAALYLDKNSAVKVL
ncbi:MAG: glucosamine-6-phosphate deaminase [Lachnospiraceae bacterium]|nr:glucosamine-6-phosphate deaminase [Lachnospiraceae bacterium]